jgi:uncharacterized protein YvpB
MEVCKGTPIIVFIKVYQNKPFLHFVPVTGYDKDNFYLAESLEFLVNSEGGNDNYNRILPLKEFKKLWNIKNIRMPLYSYTYIAARKTGEDM